MCTRSRRNCRPTSERGFTLVELLVVIGIIAILSSLLIPAISSVRATSRQTQCAHNLSQIGKAVISANTDGKKLTLIKLEEDTWEKWEYNFEEERRELKRYSTDNKIKI